MLAHAAEAAARQGRFWDFHDSLMDDQARLEDPHLWDRCRALGIDLDRFEADRRDEAAAERVRARLPGRHPRRGGQHAHPVRGRGGASGRPWRAICWTACRGELGPPGGAAAGPVL